MRRIMTGILVVAAVGCDQDDLRGEDHLDAGLVEASDEAGDVDEAWGALVDERDPLALNTCPTGSSNPAIVHVWSWYDGTNDEIKTKAHCDAELDGLDEQDACTCIGNSSLTGTVNGGVCVLCSPSQWSGQQKGGLGVCELDTTDVCLDFGDPVGFSYADQNGRVRQIDSKMSWSLSCSAPDSCPCDAASEACSCYRGYLDFSIVYSYGSGASTTLAAEGDPIIQLLPSNCSG
ncbi:MAG: hypothetical protein AAGF11_40140 [Myxococcota bacterium]